MTTRKGGTKNYKSNHQANGNTSEDYDVHYYGDDNFLKTDAYEKEKNIFESRINELEWKNQALGKKMKVLTVSVMVFLLILFIGILTISIIYELKLEQTREQLSDLQKEQINSVPKVLVRAKTLEYRTGR